MLGITKTGYERSLSDSGQLPPIRVAFFIGKGNDMSSEESTVTLTVLASQKDQAEEEFDFQACEDTGEIDRHWVYIFYGVKYGTLKFLDSLRDAGIAYDSEWSSGHEYSAGTQSGRFTSEGLYVKKGIYETQINPCMYHLLDCIDKPDELRAFILEHQESISVLPLDQVQEEYGKLYRMHQLIGVESTPKET